MYPSYPPPHFGYGGWPAAPAANVSIRDAIPAGLSPIKSPIRGSVGSQTIVPTATVRAASSGRETGSFTSSEEEEPRPKAARRDSFNDSRMPNNTLNTTIGGGKGPNACLEFNVLCNYLSRREQNGFPFDRCHKAGCAVPINKSHNFHHHVNVHFARPAYQCNACGARMKNVYSHQNKAHPDVKKADYTDLKHKFASELAALVKECHPLAGDSAFLLDTPTKPTRLLARLGGLKSFGVSVRCELCREEVPTAHTLDLEFHLYRRHFERPLFDCEMCRYQGNDIVSHCISGHDSIGIRKSGLEYFFEDRRSENEDELLRLLFRCFPGAENVVPSSLPAVAAKAPVIAPANATVDSNDTTLNQSSFRQSREASEVRKPVTFQAWCALLTAMVKKGLSTGTCSYKGCGRVVNGRAGEHVATHQGRPIEQCGLCGLRSKKAIDTHFRKEHPETRKILMMDIRYKIEEDLLRLIFECFPELQRARTFYGAIRDDERVPSAYFQRLEAMAEQGPLECSYEDCAASVEGSRASDLHIQGHLGTPLISCNSCRFQGPDIFGHTTAVHYGGKGRFIIKCEDEFVRRESELCALADRCFPL